MITLSDQERAVAFLRTKPLQHLPHLKHLHHYPNDIACFYTEHEQAEAVLLSYRAALTDWDHKAYPTASQIFLPVATNRSSAEALCQQVLNHMGDGPFVCKFCDPLTQEVFAQHFDLQHTYTFISFMAEQVVKDVSTDDVVITHNLDERIVSLYQQNGYSEDELSRLFANGATAFTIYEAQEAVCSCMIYHNFDNVWEVAGVHTLERARRKGYAQRVVCAALREIHHHDWIARYQADETNTASVRLADSLGLTICLRFEHFWARTVVSA